MIVSYGRRFAFVHVVKAGGTSVARALLPFLAPDDIASGYPDETRSWPKHMWAAKLADRLDFVNFWSFGFTRNPWDRMVSNYFWWQQVNKNGWDLDHYKRAMEGKSFEQYVLGGDWLMTSPTTDFLFKDGHQLVNFVGRFERLEEDFRVVCKVLGIEARLGKQNSSKRGDYRSYYTKPEMVDLVGARFRADIDNFGYNFE